MAPMENPDRQPAPDALRMILEGTASETGERFFMALVDNLARALGTHGAWVTEYLPESRRLRALAFRLGDAWVKDYEHPIDGTPCEVAIDERRLVHVPDRIIELYPEEPDLKRMRAVSYMGVPLLDLDGAVLGHLAVMDQRAMPERPESLTLFEIFAGRAAAELRRLRAEREVRVREAQLAGLVDSAMDAIVQLDRVGEWQACLPEPFAGGSEPFEGSELNAELRVARVNPAAERTFGLRADTALHVPLARLLSDEDAARVQRLAGELASAPAAQRSRWIAGGLSGRSAGGAIFPAEATLSLFETQGRQHFTLILRNVDERLEAERRISLLTDEAEYLRAELRELGHSGEILGRSGGLVQVLHDIEQVAPADTTVLLLGETGTGKELFARAIHAASRRRDGRW